MAVQDQVQKSRTTITYVTEINGEPAPVELPLRIMVVGDFSQGKSKDRKDDLEVRNARNLNGSNTNEVMKDMGISLEMVVPNRVNPESAESIRVKLAIDSLQAFSPEKIADQVPQIRALLLFKKLLEEIQSNIANKKEFATLLSMIYSNPQLFDKFKEELKGYAPTLPKKEIAVLKEKVEEGEK